LISCLDRSGDDISGASGIAVEEKLLMKVIRERRLRYEA
jgi:hypothetical protein